VEDESTAEKRVRREKNRPRLLNPDLQANIARAVERK
jgi:hypothetical protein